MTKLFITNAFSINMLSNNIDLMFEKVDQDDIQEFLYSQMEFIPAIGHQDTANVVMNDLHMFSQLFNRISVQPDFNNGDILIVAQYTGNRLPEGATTLPDGASINYWLVRGRKFFENYGE